MSLYIPCTVEVKVTKECWQKAATYELIQPYILWLMPIFYERKILLVGWWLMTGADLVWEKSTTGWLADNPAEQSELG
jgi:hypothetical protein